MDVDQHLRAVALWRCLRLRDLVGADALVSDLEPVRVRMLAERLAVLDRMLEREAPGQVDQLLTALHTRLLAALVEVT